ncbi:MAG: PHP domain-containing protein [Chloroflexota bacterium]|jgi:predicted metal-dependent phosphoesterase TrpH
MGQADLHIHTTYSYDGTATVRAVLQQAKTAGLDVIAITDHDEILGALEAETMCADYQIEVIPGIEISTAEGHLLALFVRSVIPAGRSLSETLLRVYDAGGVCIAAHPLAFGARSLTETAIQQAIETRIGQQVLLAVETCNASLFYLGSNAQAARIAQRLEMSAVGSSDSHVAWNIGHGRTLFKGSNAGDFKIALQQKLTQAVHFFPRRTPLFLLDHVSRSALRRLGWVTALSDPDRLPALRRLSHTQ